MYIPTTQLTTGGDTFTSGILASRPAASIAGRLYLATDVNGGTLYRDTGTAWVQNGAGARYANFEAQSGITFPTGGPWTTGTQNWTANRIFLQRVVMPVDFTVTSIVFREIGVGTGNVDVGIYDTSSNLLRSSGSTSGKKGANAFQTVSLSSTLDLVAGTVYYAAIESDTTDGSFAGPTFSNGYERVFGTTIGLGYQFIRDTTFPLTDPIGALTISSSAQTVTLI